MDAKDELFVEVDAKREEDKVVEFGDVSEQTKGGSSGFNLETQSAGKSWWVA